MLEYHLLTLVCHLSILALALLFLWSNAATFINKSPPRIPEVQIPKDPVMEFAQALRFEINRAFAVLRDIASGRDLKKFLSVCGLLVPSGYLFCDRRLMGLVYCRKLVQLLNTVLHSLRTSSHGTRAIREIRGQGGPIC
ncbi:hypothetical protein Goari_007457 [Gossypium aridum]|uniref:Reticulon-like protein n=1 Tax=Gossypium aridum TaxID=34290 RepID=A0A7J8XR80_GOSAI|nr:hypothetical protein [Gossypium aridum]